MEIYEGVVDYLRMFTIDDRDMTKFVIGTISNIDRPMTPGTKGEPFSESVFESCTVKR